MITIKRVNGMEGLKTLPEMTEHLVFQDHEDYSRGLFLDQMKQYLLAGSDKILFVTARKDEALRGYIVAVRDVKSVMILQAWSDPKNSWNVIDEMFLWVLTWAITNGIDTINAETSRDVGAMFERFGLSERSVVLERKITNHEVEQLFTRARMAFKGEEVNG